MSGLFIQILNMSLTASYVALLVIALRYVLGKARLPKIFSYALWGVVLFRLVFPFSFESAFSLLPGKAEVIPPNIVSSPNPGIASGISVIDNTINHSIQNVLPPADVAASVNPMGLLLEIGAMIWVAGFALFIAHGLLSYFGMKQRLSFATRVEGNIYETDQIKTPFVLGFIKPRIYLPVGLAKQDVGYILEHERTHIRRFDHLIKPLAFLVLMLHWFNPLIWLSYFLMIKDMEMSCDETVMKRSSGDIRVGYSNTLLALASKRSGFLSPLSFGESNVKSRIRNILHYKRPVLWIGIVIVIAVAALATGMLANPKGQAAAVPDDEAAIHADDDAAAANSEKENVANVVEAFGKKLSMVSLLAPKDDVEQSIKENYSDYVSPQLMDAWIADPENAPGRLTSSPWPDRIEIANIEKLADDAYRVEGLVIEVTSVELENGGAAAVRPITLEVRKINEKWLIYACTLGPYDEAASDDDTDTGSVLSPELSVQVLPALSSQELFDLPYLRADWTKDQMEQQLGLEKSANDGAGETYYSDDRSKYVYFDFYNAVTPAVVDVYGDYPGPRGFRVGDTFDEVMALFPQEKDWKSSPDGVFYGSFHHDAEYFDNAVSAYVSTESNVNGDPEITFITEGVYPFMRVFFEGNVVSHFTIFLIDAH